MTVNEVSRMTGVSIRTLQYYDKIGLLKPAGHTGAGYRLYDEKSLEMLQQILLFRELEFPLKEIKKIMENPFFDRDRALEQQIELLTLKKEHLENLIRLARGIKTTGERIMDFAAFDTKKMEAYKEQARKEWGSTKAYQEYEEKAGGRTCGEERALGTEMMKLFKAFGEVRKEAPGSEAAQELVKKLQSFITENYYTCTKEILAGIGMMYGAGGEFTENIDRAGGEGTAAFAGRAIAFYCKNN